LVANGAAATAVARVVVAMVVAMEVAAMAAGRVVERVVVAVVSVVGTERGGGAHRAARLSQRNERLGEGRQALLGDANVP
jgi:hypothetical protein